MGRAVRYWAENHWSVERQHRFSNWICARSCQKDVGESLIIDISGVPYILTCQILSIDSLNRSSIPWENLLCAIQ